MAANTIIRTNVLALNANRNLGLVGATKTKASAKLSSGYRINSAADDAAGLAISEKMRAQIRGLDMADKNTQDGISLIQTAEGGMQEIDNMVQRIRELVVYAGNDTADQDINPDDPEAEGEGDRSKIQGEIDQLMQEIDSMADRVEFNKKKLINGSFSAGGSNGGSAVKGGSTLTEYSVANTAKEVSLSVAETVATAKVANTVAGEEIAHSTVQTVYSSLVTALSAGMSAAPTGAEALSALSTAVSLIGTFANVSGLTSASLADKLQGTIDILNDKLAMTQEKLSAVISIGSSSTTAATDKYNSATETIDAIKSALKALQGGTMDKLTKAVASHEESLEAIDAASAVESAASAATTAHNELSVASTLANLVTEYDTELKDSGVKTAKMTAAEYEEGFGAFVAEFDDPDWNDAVTAVIDALELEKGTPGASAGETTPAADTLWFQLGANAGQGMYLNIEGVTTKELFGDSGTQHIDALSADKGGQGGNTTSINVLAVTGNEGGIAGESDGITKLLDRIDTALTKVTTERAKLGAAQNRLEYASNSLLVSSENLSSAESRIRDTDMAKEMMKLTQANVIQQAGMTMLTQANQAPQSVLSLLQ